MNGKLFIQPHLSIITVFLTTDYCYLTVGNFILTPEKLGPNVNDSWDIGPSENPEIKIKTNKFLIRQTDQMLGRPLVKTALVIFK